MSFFGTKDFLLEVAKGNVGGHSTYNKFGANTDVDTASTPEDMWNGANEYTGFNATTGDSIEVNSSNNADRGSLVSSGTATSGTATTLVDTGATFISDGVSVGDVIINDSQGVHGFVSAVTSETTLTVIKMENDAVNSTDDYRVATTLGSGAAVIKMNRLLESDYDGWKTEYIIMNGTTQVATTGTDYIRCSRAIVVLCGSNNFNNGELQGEAASTPANIFFLMPQEHNQTLIACDTVPKGKTLYVMDLLCRMGRSNGSAGSAEVDFRVRELGGCFATKTHEYITNGEGFKANGGIFIMKINEYSDFKWSILDVSDNNTQLSGQVNGVMIDN